MKTFRKCLLVPSLLLAGLTVSGYAGNGYAAASGTDPQQQGRQRLLSGRSTSLENR